MVYPPRFIGVILALAVAVPPVLGNSYKIKVKRITVPSVCGQVLGPDLKPLGLAEVKVLDAASGHESEATTTGEDGRSRIGGIKKGEYRLSVSKAGFAPLNWPMRASKTNAKKYPRSIVIFLSFGQGMPSYASVKRDELDN